MLAVIETHPIQYHAPVYRLVQQQHGIPVTAIYGSDFSVAGYEDQEFGASFAWDTDLLSGYSSVFLSRVAQGGARSAEHVTATGLLATVKSLAPRAVLIVGYSPSFHREAWLAGWRGCGTLLFRGETNDSAKSRSWLKQVARDVALRTAYQSCARLLYVGRHSRAHFERLGVESTRLVFSPYCVDPTPFDASEAGRSALRQPTRQQFGLSDHDRVILFSGKLSLRKGVDLLVDAAKQLPADLRARLVLAFLGDGALRDETLARAADHPNVRTLFLGFQNQRELSRFYHMADLLALPSRHSETWGLVVNEGLLHGLPCLVSDRVGCAPDLIDAATGQVCAAGSAEDLARAIASQIDRSQDQGVRLGCRSKVRIYSTEQAAAGIADAYSGAVSHRAA